MDITIEIEVDGPLKRAAREAEQVAVVKAFTDESVKAEIKETKYRDRRGAVEPQTLVLMLSVIASSVTIAKVLLDVVNGRKMKGRVHSVTVGKDFRVRGDMTVEDVIKLLESLKD